MSCVFCGNSASVPVKFRDTFTAYQYVRAGKYMCERCAPMLDDAKYRRKCWYQQGDTWVQIDDVHEFLDATLPTLQLPIIVYLTVQTRKHGWILAVQYPVCNIQDFTLIVDEMKVHFERDKFNVYRVEIKDFLARGIPKKVLISGEPKVSTIIHFGLSVAEVELLKSRQFNSLWWLCVKFAKNQPKIGSVSKNHVTQKPKVLSKYFEGVKQNE